MTDVLLCLLLTMAVTAGVTLWVTFQVAEEDRLVVAVSAGAMALGLCIALTFTTYRAIRARRTVARLRTLENGLARLVGEVLPKAAARVRDGASADTVLAELAPTAADVPGKLLGAVVREIGVSERQRSAAMAACANAAGRVQAMATSMLADLREMEGRHAENVLGDLLKLDHSTAQTGRLADSIAVLTGARSGRRWTKPIVMESILRGAMGRIQAYQRVQVHSSSTAAVVGYAAEDVMHALAELMDNATRFSAPSEEVHVYVEELHTGVVVTIEDGGLGMKPQALARAESAVSTDGPLDLAKVPGTRLGLVVVGSLARKHKLQVYFRPSSRGGTGVVIRIPQQLVIHPRADAPATARTDSRTAGSVRAGSGDTATATGATATTTTRAPVTTATAVLDSAPPPTEDTVELPELPELPKRPRGQTLAAAVRATEAKRKPGERTEKRTDIGARFSAFQQGRRSTTPDQSAGEEDSL
ncbi:sensor histidine kinase [Actinophytocola algeriensis]|uniref:histidine kinase n=1 Tax=Actinophytocola algeriensis TaxID=1768010 RepID=A0A7W7Q894_9PSEU|nr:ATP-binding protein [Actinophytocola algeriensis]MBB4908441.1 signal transduction histidine kinase [Actinophytocola algeriensis]MBE1475172.1 signal transduction histidine kinase [Actinophytocola algeriensis]